MESLRIQNKIKLLFEKIVEPNYVMNNYYADGLINKLSCSDPEISNLETMPLISDLIVEALNNIHNAHSTVKVFVTRMLAIASQKELHFSKIFSKEGEKIHEGFKEINSSDMNPSLRVAFMEVALAILQHNSGISWLLGTGVWKEILTLCNEKRTVFVVRQTYKFAAEFLWKLNDLEDQVNLKIIIGLILKPVLDVDFLQVETMSSEEEEEISKTIEPMLQILYSVVNKDNRIEKPTILMAILITDFTITSHLYVILDRLRKEETTLLISKLIFYLMLSKTFLTKPMAPGLVFSMDDFLQLGVSFFNITQSFQQRRNAMLILDNCTACILIWAKVWKDKTCVKWVCQDKKIDLQNQMIFLCLMPLLVFVTCAQTSSMTNETVNDYIMKLFNLSCEYTAKSAYALRDLTLELDTYSIVLQSVKKISYLKSHLNDEQANLVFQALFYVLKQYEPLDEYGELKIEENYEDSQEKMLVLTHVMDTVQSLVKHHNINWHESLEVICLCTVVFNVLKRPNLTCKFVVASINVIMLTVKKFLTPSLSLLLESKPGCPIHGLGKFIYMKMHDMHWEVRDSALELLLVCTEISFIKFPPFQKQIMENNLINVAATIAFHDYESYVQVSALKCVGAASKINTIWEQLTAEFPDIKEKLLSILRNSQEGIVRKEACNVLCEVYQNIKLTPVFKQTIYEHMVSSVLSDFHWEVQLNALKFWRIVYHNLLTDQGMLDGTFPPVTFSRETRKIVTLNEKEIQKRLQKILCELSSIGCITVLIKLLHDEVEVEVMETALNFSLELLDILNKYNVPDILKANPGDLQSVDEVLSAIKDDKCQNNDVEDMPELNNDVKADKVIEGILKSDDISLLANIYESHMSLQDNKSEPLEPKIRLHKFASPHLFVTYLVSKDFKEIVKHKRLWSRGIRSVSSLLDDVLGIYEVISNDEVNSLDCY